MFNQALEFLSDKDKKKIAMNCTMSKRFKPGGGLSSIEVWYYSTCVLTIYPDDTFMLDSGGWTTMTTAKRIHTAFAKIGLDYKPVRLYLTNKFPHVVDGRGAKIKFFDGMIFNKRGICKNYWTEG
jgi:hypothetical protein